MSNPPKLVLNPFLFDESEKSEGMPIQSLVNREYLDNLPNVRKQIEKRRAEEIRAEEELRMLVIK